MSKLNTFLMMHFADDAFCAGALLAAMEDYVEGAISERRLSEVFADAAIGRGSDIAELAASRRFMAATFFMLMEQRLSGFC